MHLVGDRKRINTRNDLGYLLGQTNGGPWFAIAIYPKGITVDATSGRKESVVVYGGKNLSEYRMSVTFAPIVNRLVEFAGEFAAKIYFDGKFLICKLNKEGVAAIGKVYLEQGIIWKDVLELIQQAVWKAMDNYRKMTVICFKVLDTPQVYSRAANAIGANAAFLILMALLTVFADLL